VPILRLTGSSEVSTHLWTPGAAGPLDDFIARVMRMVGAFAAEHELEQAEVRIELADGARHTVASMTPEPGFGFFSFTPHVEAGEEPLRLIVPIGVVRSIELSAPDPERPFGFVVVE
jgi:hypothetical protein